MDTKKLLLTAILKKNDGSTIELDIVMIHETGIYVFESKNYSGWIFGSEKKQILDTILTYW